MKVPEMMKIKLTTANGALVHVAEMIPYKTMPDVVCWGSRYFKRWGEAPDVAPYAEEYREIFVVYLPPSGLVPGGQVSGANP